MKNKLENETRQILFDLRLEVMELYSNPEITKEALEKYVDDYEYAISLGIIPSRAFQRIYAKCRKSINKKNSSK